MQKVDIVVLFNLYLQFHIHFSTDSLQQQLKDMNAI
jgi:hypothetical protein